MQHEGHEAHENERCEGQPEQAVAIRLLHLSNGRGAHSGRAHFGPLIIVVLEVVIDHARNY